MPFPRTFLNGIMDQLWSICSVSYQVFSHESAVDAFIGHPDKLIPPVRDITSPLRFPISNVFKQQNMGAAISGRLCGGIVQVGEKLRVLPGDETAIVKCEDVLSHCFLSLFLIPLSHRIRGRFRSMGSLRVKCSP